MSNFKVLLEIATSDGLLEVGRKAVEDALIEMRDSRIFVMRNNGLVVKEKNGECSNVIRMGPEDCIRIGLLAIIKHLRIQQNPN